MRPAFPTTVLLSIGLAGCWTQQVARPGQTTGTGTGGTDGGGGAEVTFQILPNHHQLDLLFVVDDSAGTSIQSKLAAQLPTFMQVLQALPDGLPDLHVGVLSADLGGGGDPPAGCTVTGDGGELQAAPRGDCAATTLAAGAAFISTSDGAPNFTAPIDQVVSCILPLGTGGCGYGQPLAALVRALGADGAPAPAGNQEFLRHDAALGIVILSAVDDCSTPPASALFMATPGTPGLLDPLGPLTHYRCNRYGHLCSGMGTMLAPPPLAPSPGGPDDAGTEQLFDCMSNDQPGGRLTPVSDIVSQLRQLKETPDDRIAVSAIVGPPVPYGVRWTPAGAANPQSPDELWPSVMQSCGTAGDPAVNPAGAQRSTDGSSGEPAVRIAEFVRSFQHGVVVSACDADYAQAVTNVAADLGGVARGVKCSPSLVPSDAQGQPLCTVTAHYLDAQKQRAQLAVPNCAMANDELPCWTAGSEGSPDCRAGGRPLYVSAPPAFEAQAALIYDVSCPLCDSTSRAGCS